MKASIIPSGRMKNTFPGVESIQSSPSKMVFIDLKISYKIIPSGITGYNGKRSIATG